MTIPTTADLLALLDRLDAFPADDLETPWLDFKPWQGAKEDMKVAVEYAACFANADGGAVVFGVADRSRGRAQAIHGASGYDLDVWRRGIFDSTRPNLEVEVTELTVPEGTGKLLVVRIPKGPHPPYGTAQGLFKQRVGKNCMPLDAQSFVRAQVAAGNLDWSGARAQEIAADDLDPVEIARARNVLRRNQADSELLRLSDPDLLVALGAIRHGHVTHAGMLLFARTDRLRDICPQHQVHFTSPGGFIAGITPRNILRHEPVSRNRTLAEAFEKLRLVERAGIGRRRIFETTLSYGKRIPEYEADGMVTLRIYDGGFDAKMAALVARWRGEGRDLGLDGLLILSFLRDNAFIDTLSAARLLQLPREAARGDSQSARVEASRYLRSWCEESGFLRREGMPPKVRYLPRGQSTEER